MALLLVFVGVGMVRVTLSAKAAEASIDAGRLRQEIKSAKFVTDDLEIDRSALLKPSRIEAIASATMRMTKPGDVRYIAVSPQGRQTGPTEAVLRSAPSGRSTSMGTVRAGAAQTNGMGAALRRALASVVGAASDSAHLLLAIDGSVVSGE